MKKRLIITYEQFNRLCEGVKTSQELIIDEMKKELTGNYSIEPTLARAKGDYIKKPMVKILADEQFITPADLFKYLNGKYAAKHNISNGEFIEQIIKDWVDGDTSSKLSKIINMN